MKLLKILIGTVITLVLLFVAGITVLVTLVNPNDFKSKITETVQQETGRDLEIGNISWSFFPWVGIKVNDVSFSNGADFKGQDFIKVGEAGLRVEFLPIFKGQVRVGALTLKNADIKLMKNKAGKTNWQDLTASKNSSAPVKQDSSGATGSKSALISISSINISNANVSWNDAQAGEKLDIQDFNLHCKGIEIDPNAKELSNQLKLQGDVNIGQVAADKVRISDIKTHISFEQGVLGYAV